MTKQMKPFHAAKRAGSLPPALETQFKKLARDRRSAQALRRLIDAAELLMAVVDEEVARGVPGADGAQAWLRHTQLLTLAALAGAEQVRREAARQTFKRVGLRAGNFPAFVEVGGEG